MKAISPVRSFRKNSASVTEQSLGVSRMKTPADDPLSLLYNMNDCYSKLKELVPSIPQNKHVSKMEILQHVIDYILDLQIALDSHSAINTLHHPRPGQGSSRTPLTTINTDIRILSLQVNLLDIHMQHNNQLHTSARTETLLHHVDVKGCLVYQPRAMFSTVYATPEFQSDSITEDSRTLYR
ncbi:DNA-binding protein inhibitor ID-2 [Bagarius yarrelli]|uniref:DNA-binding protein inhibitor ID-2 n=1 Tax=Bagarius yarrelli TaxID=175774 RepID=A0A556U7N9_BAGYA|nr:DNA-binding protein inhibitor ID-2 [Bagarius yarrelli]